MKPENTTDHEIEILDSSTALSVINRAEIDSQIATAKQYPRSIKEFKRQAMELATLDEETAASMFYALPRAGKNIQGPSVRLAEVVQSCWGNIRAESDVVAIDEKFVTAMGSCMDLEKNVATRIRVKRRITDKHGKRFNDDMIGVTSNAACSIALREAIFKVIPRALVKDVYQAAIATAVGDAKSLTARRHSAIEWFNKTGVPTPKILARLDRKGIEDVTLDDLIVLTGLRTAIKDGEASIEDAFTTEATGPTVGTQDLNAQIAAAANGKTKQAKPKISKPNGATKDPFAPSIRVELPDTESDLYGDLPGEDPGV